MFKCFWAALTYIASLIVMETYTYWASLSENNDRVCIKGKRDHDFHCAAYFVKVRKRKSWSNQMRASALSWGQTAVGQGRCSPDIINGSTLIHSSSKCLSLWSTGVLEPIPAVPGWHTGDQSVSGSTYRHPETDNHSPLSLNRRTFQTEEPGPAGPWDDWIRDRDLLAVGSGAAVLLTSLFRIFIMYDVRTTGL